jgi:hypothetical protein
MANRVSREPNHADPALEVRLTEWFSTEVRRAEADLAAAARAPVLPVAARRRPSTRSSWALPLAAVVVVVGVFVAVELPRFGPGILSGLIRTGSPTAGATTPSTAAATPSTSPPTIEKRYPDGIPSLVDGEKVVRPPELSAGRPSPDVTTYLLGGWSPGPFARACPPFHAGDPTYFLTPTCGGWPIGDTPLVWDTPPPLNVNVSVRTDGHVVPAGPVVLRVHVDDPRAVQCLADRRAACEEAIVVDEVVWVGQDDPLTATAPLRADQVADHLLTVFSDIRFLPREERCGDGALCPKSVYIGSDCDPGWPLQTWETNVEQLGRILVFPSIAAREKTEGKLTPSGWRGTDASGSSCMVTTDANFASDWIAVENVLVDVHVAPAGPTAAQRAMIDEIRTALSAHQ